MQVRSVIEVAPSGGRLPAGLMIAAYRDSQNGLVVFVLNDATPQAVNRVLDPIVRTLPLWIPGVLFISIKDVLRVRDAVLSARAVYAQSMAFRRLLAGCETAGGKVHSIAAAIAELRARLPLPAELNWYDGLQEPDDAAALLADGWAYHLNAPGAPAKARPAHRKLSAANLRQGISRDRSALCSPV